MLSDLDALVLRDAENEEVSQAVALGVAYIVVAKPVVLAQSVEDCEMLAGAEVTTGERETVRLVDVESDTGPEKLGIAVAECESEDEIEAQALGLGLALPSPLGLSIPDPKLDAVDNTLCDGEAHGDAFGDPDRDAPTVWTVALGLADTSAVTTVADGQIVGG